MIMQDLPELKPMRTAFTCTSRSKLIQQSSAKSPTMLPLASFSELYLDNTSSMPCLHSTTLSKCLEKSHAWSSSAGMQSFSLTLSKLSSIKSLGSDQSTDTMSTSTTWRRSMLTRSTLASCGRSTCMIQIWSSVILRPAKSSSSINMATGTKRLLSTLFSTDH